MPFHRREQIGREGNNLFVLALVKSESGECGNSHWYPSRDKSNCPSREFFLLICGTRSDASNLGDFGFNSGNVISRLNSRGNINRRAGGRRVERPEIGRQLDQSVAACIKRSGGGVVPAAGAAGAFMVVKSTAPANVAACVLTLAKAAAALAASATVMKVWVFAFQSTQASDGGAIVSAEVTVTQSRVLKTGRPVCTVTSIFWKRKGHTKPVYGSCTTPPWLTVPVIMP